MHKNYLSLQLLLDIYQTTIIFQTCQTEPKQLLKLQSRLFINQLQRKKTVPGWNMKGTILCICTDHNQIYANHNNVSILILIKLE